MTKYSIGLDFGTESARAVLVDTANGAIIATAVELYKHGVIDDYLTTSGEKLPPDWALQWPGDWLESTQITIQKIMSESKIEPNNVIGIGLDFTACTILPTLKDSTPLCELEKYQNNPHAFAKLWKHHAAQPQADKVNALAKKQSKNWLARYGGIISSEWLIPKALEIVENAAEIYQAADYIIEASDWLPWVLSGKLKRNSCAAGYKDNWHKNDGDVDSKFLSDLNPKLANLYSQKLAAEVVPAATKIAGLSQKWAKKLGLKEGIAIGAGIIDAHSALLGGGISSPNQMFMIMGTSSCQLVMSKKEVLAEGISGVVEDGILPGLFAYEAGQAGVGDIFAWFVKNQVPSEYQEKAKKQNISVHELLSNKAAKLKVAESGLLVLDWLNGCRTPLVDAELSGLVLGLSLSTKPEEIYRALIEATAFGNRLIIENFEEQGIKIERLVSAGGLSKNKFLMQIYADILQHEIELAASEQASALGAAMLGAVAAGSYDNLKQAIDKMAAKPKEIYYPNLENKTKYDILYTEYKNLVNYFGKQSNLMKTLRSLKNSN